MRHNDKSQGGSVATGCNCSRGGVFLLGAACILLHACTICTGAPADVDAGVLSTARVDVAFGSDCETLLIREIDAAEEELLIAIYSITRKNITAALARAAGRGVKVRLKYDARSCEWPGMKTAIGYLRNRDVECLAITMTGKYGKMHHKFAVIDQKRVVTGSYNFTTTGSIANYENLVLLESGRVARAFKKEFEAIKGR